MLNDKNGELDRLLREVEELYRAIRLKEEFMRQCS